MLALAALVAAIQHRCDPFPELEAAAARNGVAVGSEEFDEAATLAGQPYCRALDLYVDRETKRRAAPWGRGWRTWPSSRPDPSKPGRVG